MTTVATTLMIEPRCRRCDIDRF